MIKKTAAVILTLFMLCTLFCACGEYNFSTDGFHIVCTVFPQYDWVKNIVGATENVNIEVLLDSGTDLHSYQPTASDIVTMASADVFIYIGGESDKWIEDVLKTTANENTYVLNLMESLGEENLYCVEEIGEEHTHNDSNAHHHTHDEHIWLSPKKAITLTETIKNVLCEKDTVNKASYEENYSLYLSKLQALDKSYEDGIKNANKDTVIFADRFPFIYLTKDYGINYHAAFSGCSSDSEASFETVTRLANKTDELSASALLITETSDAAVANTVKNSTKNKNQQILTMNSLQSVSKDKLGSSYIEIMEENLNILKTALS
ncbi:MAG: zinc ABC transporter substrate-binding protein [Clostridia bacterium]|nr:zinc ABC transporter substrate-binding protein [Clostridia bacterium]